ncbi:MAG: glycosyltransferase family 39 protein, partial [Chloroflexi bacterium]|nr:glycosyltransferase family 39 protein [Chloroflexota bacterium]
MHVLRASRFSQRASAFSRRNAVLLALLALLAISLSLRLYGLNWDGGALYHPDERAILWQGTEFSGKRGVSEIHKPANLSEFFSVESPLNPHWFPYGSLSIYLLKGLSWVLSPMLGPYSLHDYAVLGRALNAIVDSATMLLVFLLAARLFGRRVGLLAAAFTTFAALHIQLSHFYASDVLLTFFAVLTMLFLSRVAARGDPLSALLAGVALGLGVATKVSFAPMLAAVFVAYALYAFFADETAKGVTFNAQRLQVALAGLLMTVGAAGIAFVVTQPYAVIDWRAFARDVNEQSEMVRRIRDYPYTRQYIDTPAYLYPAVQFAKWSVGPLLGVLAWLGFAFGLVAAAAYRRRADILLLSWVVPYFLITGWFDVKFLRYMLPIAPFLAIFAARLLVAAYDWLKAGHRPRLNPRWALAVTGVVLLATAFYGVAYTRIYSRPHPAQAMARWIDQNVPPGARIAREHWDECVVGRFWSCDPNAPNGMLIVESYNDDTPFKQNQLISQLQQADYTVHFSNRLYGTIPRLPERYPMTTAFYQRLMDGSLGFELLRAETSYPGLFGVSFVDDTFTRPGLATPAGFDRFRPGGLTFNLGFADESFSVYDHPTVLLFKKVRQLSPEELRKLLPLGQQSAGPLPLTYAAEGAREQQQGGTWSKIFDPDGLFNKVPELTWLVMVQLIFLLTLPLGLVLFRALPDRGYLLIKALGILLTAFVPWLLASLHWMPFSRGSILLGLLLIALASGLCLWRWRTELWDFLRQRWKLVLAAEVLFLVAFFSFYALRLANPDLWHPYRGGEKPMDFAYLNAVTRSTWMPPYDPWFAGGYLNYYYFGHVILGALLKLTGIAPAVAYNLAIPTIAGYAASAAASLGLALGHDPARPRRAVLA